MRFKAGDKVEAHKTFFKDVSEGRMMNVLRNIFSNVIDPGYVNAEGDNILNVLARTDIEYLSNMLGPGMKDQNMHTCEILVTALLRHSYPPDVHHKDADGRTPLLAAVEEQNDFVASVLLKHSNADIHRADARGRTPWTCALAAQHWDTILSMLRGCKLRLPLTDEKALVRAAAQAGQADVICTLIRRRLFFRGLGYCVCEDRCWDEKTGRERSLTAVSGDSLLMTVLRAGADRVVVDEVLQAVGVADINKLNSEGESCLSLAIAAEPRHWNSVFDRDLLETNAHGNSASGTSQQSAQNAVGVDPARGAVHRSEDGYNAGAVQERVDVVRALLALRPAADINLKHPCGNTPIMFAAMHGLPVLVEELLDASPAADACVINADGDTLLMLLLTAIYDDVLVEDTQLDRVVSRVIEASRGLINHANSAGFTALHSAAAGPYRSSTYARFYKRSHRFVQKLLQAGADANIADSHGETPLMRALQRGPLPLPAMWEQHAWERQSVHLSRMTRLYVARSNLWDSAWLTSLIVAQNVTPLVPKDATSRCAASLAAEYWPDALPKLLDVAAARGQHVAAKASSVLLMLAAAARSHRAVARLLETREGWDINERDDLGRTALSHAVAACAAASQEVLKDRDFSRVIDILLAAGADPDIADVRSETPLMLAGLCNDGRPQAALLDAPSRPDLAAIDAQSSTALHYLFKSFRYTQYRFGRHPNRVVEGGAAQGGERPSFQPPDAARVRQLLQAEPGLASAMDSEGRTALLLAAQLDCRKHEGLLAECIGCMLQSGVDVDCADSNLETPVMAAVRRGNGSALRRLLDAGADLTRRHLCGDTALIMAIKQGDARCVELLIEREAGVELSDAAGENALLIAARHGLGEVVEMLLGPKAHAKPDVNDARGRSALLLAVGHGHAGIALQLLKAGAISSLRGLAERQPSVDR